MRGVTVNLSDVHVNRAAVADEVADGWRHVLEQTAFVGGTQVAAFERDYAAFTRTRHCVAVANGTDAIEIALPALGVGPGDECILPANTFLATAEAVCRIGAIPVLVDCVDDGTCLLDPGAVEAAIGPRTAAVIPVHLYGQAAPVERLMPDGHPSGGGLAGEAETAGGMERCPAGGRRRVSRNTW